MDSVAVTTQLNFRSSSNTIHRRFCQLKEREREREREVRKTHKSVTDADCVQTRLSRRNQALLLLLRLLLLLSSDSVKCITDNGNAAIDRLTRVASLTQLFLLT